MNVLVNRCQITGTIAERQSIRYTPSGLPALEAQITHESDDTTGHDATVNLSVIAFGMLAQALHGVSLESQLELIGFLRHSAKSKKLMLQVESFKII